MMHNNLFLNRLVVFTKEGKKAYDEKFKKGINIITGDNSSGKSTISHFIFYILGGSFTDWTREAKKCSEVFAEVEMNGATLTLKREISDSPQMPMYIYWGKYVDALKVTIGGQWQKFPYKASDKKSFSNVLFEQLEIPIVVGDSNITMHQLLRLMYIDQESPTNSLYMYESFDSPLTRQTVSELLLGIYDESLYADRINKKDAEKKLSSLKTEIEAIRSLYSDKRLLNPEHIKNLINQIEVEKSEVEESIINLRQNTKKVNYTQKSKLNFEEINSEALKTRERVNKLQNEINNLNYEITDSEYFLQSLHHKRKSINNSIATRENLGSYHLDYCPECLSKLDAIHEGSCKLCKQEVDDSFGVTQARRMEQELTFQIRESEKLMLIRKENLSDLVISYDNEKVKLKDVQDRVNFSLKDVTSFRDERIDSLLIKKGELDGATNQFLTFLETADKHASLRDNQGRLEFNISNLKDSIEAKEKQQITKKNKIKSSIEHFALQLLKKDFEREEVFKNARNIDINYYDNAIYVDGDVRNFSASSNFYLKITARFSIFFASLKIENMRYPRFIMCDNMEDKGIEKGRSQNFQNLIVKTASEFSNEDYQMIFTTSMISDDLKHSEYIVGEHYTINNKTLKHV